MSVKLIMLLESRLMVNDMLSKLRELTLMVYVKYVVWLDDVKDYLEANTDYKRK